MPIPASQIVEVNPRVVAPGGNDLDFNSLFLTSSTIIPLSQFVVAFTSAADVGAYFGLDSEEYSLASTYFQGFNNSQAKPNALMFAPRVDSAQPAFVRGAAYGGTLADLQGVTDGTFSIALGGVTVELDSLTFATATSFSSVADMLQTAINGWKPTEGSAPAAVTAAMVSYDSTLGAFTVTSGTAGPDDGIALPSGSVASLLGFDNGVVSAGANAMTPAENMEACLAVTRNFVCFMSIEQLSAADCIAFSAWAAAQGVNYLHVFWDDDLQNTATTPSGTIAQALTEANAGAVCGIYGTAQYGAFICSCAGCIDYDRTAGTITFMFKGQSGLPANVTNGSVAETLNSIGMNFVGNYATRNDAFVFLANGEMWGEWKWIDSYLNAIWLCNALQVACMVGLQNNLRVPYTDEGYALVRSWCMDPINRALRSGVIEPGVTLSESQISQLQREVGKDISQQLYSDGYYLHVEDPAPAIRQQREAVPVSCVYTYGGAVHRLSINAVAEV